MIPSRGQGNAADSQEVRRPRYRLHGGRGTNGMTAAIRALGGRHTITLPAQQANTAGETLQRLQSQAPAPWAQAFLHKNITPCPRAFQGRRDETQKYVVTLPAI